MTLSYRYTPEQEIAIRAAFTLSSFDRKAELERLSNITGRTVSALRSKYTDMEIREQSRNPGKRRAFTEDEDAHILALGPRPRSPGPHSSPSPAVPEGGRPTSPPPGP